MGRPFLSLSLTSLVSRKFGNGTRADTVESLYGGSVAAWSIYKLKKVAGPMLMCQAGNFGGATHTFSCVAHSTIAQYLQVIPRSVFCLCL